MEEMMKEIVEYRVNHGIDVNSNENVIAAAIIRAVEMAWSDKYSDTRPNGTSWKTVLNELEVSYSKAEEFLSSASTLEEAVHEFTTTNAYQMKLLDTSYPNIGIGKATVNNKSYWVLILTD